MQKIKKSRCLILLIVLLLVIPVVPGCAGSRVEAAQYSVSLDVNPSIELTITDDLVTAVKAFNDDGTEILFDTEVLGISAADAVAAIVREMIGDGYIAESEIEPCLLITVSDETQGDTEESAELTALLQTAAEGALDASGLDCRITSTSVAQEVKSAGEALGISAGRYVLFACIALDESMTIEEAIATYGHLTIGELVDMFDAIQRELAVSENPETSDPESSSGSSSTEEESEESVLKPAIEQFKAAKKAAIEAFQTECQTISTEYKDGLKALQQKGKKGAVQDINAQRTVLKETMLAKRRAAHETKKAAFTAARETFLQAVSDKGLSDEDVEESLEEADSDVPDPDGDDQDSGSDPASSVAGSAESSTASNSESNSL